MPILDWFVCMFHEYKTYRAYEKVVREHMKG